ncbi:MBL fold metallo-hydrolase [Nocardia stercoris]|uniref:MBL fold metallo-hydrolase n=1 Tax=Nocardia stercoris TaxID=2483361 RepID=A0A3M2L5P1_9NOCA|nr:MBL fold metallo-hydrolase [Nocardia stercoris]RMI32931.1 MBL fold metallo-hydrolase [Nocardia stercoris]
MRVHHLNGGTMRPVGGGLLDGGPGLLRRAELVCHCLLIEHDTGLILVETGIGERGARTPAQWLGPQFAVLTNPVRDVEQTVGRQIEALGFDRSDVRDIVLTHLDLDHAGGLVDFPNARVHVHATELDAARNASGLVAQQRYVTAQFAHGPDWRTYSETGESWFGFDAVRDLEGLPPSILLIPLAGHTRGHTGVAIETGDGWLLHAGDAYMNAGEVDLDRPRTPPLTRFFENVMQALPAERRANLQRLQQLRRDHSDAVTIFCAHDGSELQAMRDREPAPGPQGS